ncbi:MAG TPA: Holliday junction branch migration protein RuvA [Candidatus Hydrogenedens sp.]|nr:Holliday junction branch migration protein RuvA [Candidatus Hydrogenedens sp.]HPP58733.1 Holliday junction branch migration protein RuvA [Candidatus Hydrogenedens sp.]
MFDYLRGVITKVRTNTLVLDIQGVGYLLNAPISLLNKVHVNEEAMFPVYTVWREDSVDIYAFESEEQKLLFQRLIAISGIGPKMAIAILSTLSVNDFRKAVMGNDYHLIATAPGIGKKTAQRLILEFRNKMGEDIELSALLTPREEVLQDTDEAYQAMVSMGCSASEAKSAVSFARKQLGENASIEDLIRIALRYLKGGFHS